MGIKTDWLLIKISGISFTSIVIFYLTYSNIIADLIKKGIFIPMVPQYMIVGKEGELIENNALRPSSGEELYNQLKEAISPC